MIDTTTRAILQSNAKRVLILGTASTYGDDLYGKRLNTQGTTCLYPTAHQQDFIETYIRTALDQQLGNTIQQQFAHQVEQIALETQADGVVLACTDLTGDLPDKHAGLRVFDPLQLLAIASAEYVLGRDDLFVDHGCLLYTSDAADE